VLSHVVIVRRDLSPGVQLAYAVHAAGESPRETVPAGTRAVVLAAEDEGHLRVICGSLEASGVAHTPIEEDGQLFSVGLQPQECEGDARRITRSLPLAG
jgi:hypothetical protein